ncbi:MULTISPECIES: sigma-70 family RNA polymerase sigma factor [unclassified Streptomyces]|uniref:sigma-70 family RNA polymerase sigma factor n=1 Tax=unclassified Streptomyces TaxID=2593676 RepID=UPI000DADA35E|nr:MULTISPECIES: sigma-70 family RNA polymerase sigma factor [unclassified Streptomyces]PZT72614.1 RNA polymerase sigma factor [Streptomyces sp. AC1-42T]PZT81067.1 RNA polymerase sigma factor [Streptomyces sp. AC1-42W]
MPQPQQSPLAGGLPQPMLKAAQAARREFLAALEPLRGELFQYCRRLTGSVWDAEDLAQEALARAFTRAAQTHQPVERPMAWLVRIATNAYLDQVRRPAPLLVEPSERAAPPGADPAEVRDALAEVATLLAPQERAAVVLKDVFDLPLKEIAAMLNTTEGAVKAALHRGRGRLADPERAAALTRRTAPDRDTLDALAAAFTSYDLGGLTKLFVDDAVSDVIGVAHEVGRDQIAAGSLHHTLHLETSVRWRAEVRELDGDPLVLVWATPADGSGPEAVEDVLRAETADGGITRLRWYYFCPDVLTEVAVRLGVPCRTHGHHA